MKVLFLTAYSSLAASSRTRVYNFLPFLEKRGINFKCICFSTKWLHKLSQNNKKGERIIYYSLVIFLKPIKILQALFSAPFYDIIFIQKITFLFRLEKIIKLFNKNIIFDFDDAIFTSERGKNGFFKRIRFYFQKGSFKNMLRIAKCCIVENEYNKGKALEFCPWIETVTGPIDTEKYFVEQARKEGRVVIGWTGSGSTTRYLYAVKDALREVSKKYNVVLKFVGVNDDFRIEDTNCQIEKWSLDKEISQVQSFDIGIMPIPDNEWTRGKGGYKILQYMAVGIPAIASPVGINKKIINDGINGFLAESEDDWVKTLSLLVENGELRKKIGLAGRKSVEENYSLKRASEKMMNIFENLLK